MSLMYYFDDIYPLFAIVGQDCMKIALLLNANFSTSSVMMPDWVRVFIDINQLSLKLMGSGLDMVVKY